jgi:hypothetical protein
MPRRSHTPDPTLRRQVEAMAAYGVPEADIARVIGIDPKTLRKHYREELDTGHIRATAKVAESLFRKATGEGAQSVTAAIFWLKTRGGWKETSTIEVAGGSRPLTVEYVQIRGVSAEPGAGLPPPRPSEEEWERKCGERADDRSRHAKGIALLLEHRPTQSSLSD